MHGHKMQNMFAAVSIRKSISRGAFWFKFQLHSSFQSGVIAFSDTSKSKTIPVSQDAENVCSCNSVVEGAVHLK